MSLASSPGGTDGGRYRGRMPVSVADLAMPLGRVAASFPQWADDPEPVVGETLAASARGLHDRAYTLWAWTGVTTSGVPAVVLAIPAATAHEFRPAGPARALTRSLAAAVEAGAEPTLALGEWLGHLVLADPGLDTELLAVALDEQHPAPARVSLARLPGTLPLEVTPLALGAAPDAADLPVSRVGARAGVHPIEAALALAARGASLEHAEDHASEVLARLSHGRDADGAGATQEAGNEAEEAPVPIDDDPLPRRRQARRLLRRLFGMKKIGAVHHTAFDHLYRGVPADDRADALEVGEALIRAGLLGEKPSVGQRHVFLRREALPEIHALMDRAEASDPALAAFLGATQRADGVATAPRRSP